MDKTMFCTECLDTRRTKKVTTNETYTIKNEQVDVEATYYQCTSCGEWMYDPENPSENLKKAYIKAAIRESIEFHRVDGLYIQDNLHTEAFEQYIPVDDLEEILKEESFDKLSENLSECSMDGATIARHYSIYDQFVARHYVQQQIETSHVTNNN